MPKQKLYLYLLIFLKKICPSFKIVTFMNINELLNKNAIITQPNETTLKKKLSTQMQKLTHS